MIQEYALDPEVLANEFHKDARFFDEAFGSSSIRFISCFPKRWRDEVLAAFRRSPLNDDVLLQKKLTRFVDGAVKKAIKRNHGQLAAGSWLNKAEVEHNREPFHAILTNRNPNNNEKIVELNSIPDHPCWDAPRSCRPRRSISELAAIAEPLLMRSSDIIFVDPYFDIALDKYRAVFSEYFRCIERSIVSTRPRITIITGLKGVWERGVREPDGKNVNDFIDSCSKELPLILPKRCECTIAIIKEIRGGQQFHNRFILTKNVAIKFGIGLDSLSDNTQSYDDIDITVYSKGETLWELYNLQRQPPAFSNVKDPFVVNSTG